MKIVVFVFGQIVVIQEIGVSSQQNMNRDIVIFMFVQQVGLDKQHMIQQKVECFEKLRRCKAVIFENEYEMEFKEKDK